MSPQRHPCASGLVSDRRRASCALMVAPGAWHSQAGAEDGGAQCGASVGSHETHGQSASEVKDQC